MSACSVQCTAVFRTTSVYVCVCVCCVALARAGGRFIVDVSWPLQGLLHVKVNGEYYKVILLVCLLFAPLITPACGPVRAPAEGPAG